MDILEDIYPPDLIDKVDNAGSITRRVIVA